MHHTLRVPVLVSSQKKQRSGVLLSVPRRYHGAPAIDVPWTPVLKVLAAGASHELRRFSSIPCLYRCTVKRISVRQLDATLERPIPPPRHTAQNASTASGFTRLNSKPSSGAVNV